MIRKIHALLKLKPADRQIVYQGCYWLFAVGGRLKRWPFARVLQWVRSRVEGHKRAGRGEGRNVPELRALCGWVERCARNMPGEYLCLPQALAGYIVCSRCGYAPQLRVGVTRSPGAELQAHAWLEMDGVVVLGDLPDLHTYRPFQQSDNLVW